MLFRSILRLQRQIESLNARIDELSAGAQSGHGGGFQPVEEIPSGDDVPVRSLVRFQPFSSPLPPCGGAPLQPESQSSPVTLEETERDTIRRALERNGGKRKEAARELNISERTLYRKIKDYGIEL